MYSMQWMLRKLMDETTWRTGQRCTYERIHQATGVSMDALSKMARGETKRADVHTIERLLDYFEAQLERELATDDLLARRRGGDAEA